MIEYALPLHEYISSSSFSSTLAPKHHHSHLAITLAGHVLCRVLAASIQLPNRDTSSLSSRPYVGHHHSHLAHTFFGRISCCAPATLTGCDRCDRQVTDIMLAVRYFQNHTIQLDGKQMSSIGAESDFFAFERQARRRRDNECQQKYSRVTVCVACHCRECDQTCKASDVRFVRIVLASRACLLSRESVPYDTTWQRPQRALTSTDLNRPRYHVLYAL